MTEADNWGKLMVYPKITLDHIPDQDLKGIGLVAQAWAFLEGAIERICWLMAELEYEAQGQALTTHMTHRSRYDAALALLHEQFPDSEPESRLRSLSNKISNELPSLRNEIVHSRLLWSEGVERPIRAVYKARRKVAKTIVKVGLHEYGQVAEQILDVTNEVVEILNQLVELIRTRDGQAPEWTDRSG